MNIPLNIDWQQILLHLLNFVILAGGLYLLLYQPVKAFMEKRQAYYREQDAQAAKLLADAKQTAAEVQQKMKDADAAAADASIQQQLSEAQTQADRILADAHAAARREHDKLLDDAQKDLKDLAVTAAKKLVFQSGGDAFDQFLNQAEREEPHA